MQNRRKPLRNFLRALAVLFFPFAAFGQTSAVTPRITAAVNESQLTTLRGNTHPYARAQYSAGAAPDSLPMERMLLVLQRSPAQESALQALLAQQQDSSSPNYHAWLTPQQFGREFGPADADIQTITEWLQSEGFTVNRVSNGRTVIEFSGTAGQVRAAFHTQIRRYSVNGQDHWANASDPQIPTALTPVVAGVFTLHNFLKKPQVQISETPIHARVTTGADGKTPHVTFNDNPAVEALAPADFAKIYDMDPNYQPAGGYDVRIGVVARSNIDAGDVDGFDSYLPLNPLNRVGSPTVILNGPDPGDLGGSEEVEAVLDTSWSGALLPNNPASILLVVSGSTYTTDGVDLSEIYIIDNNFADVMTESFGECEADFTSAEATGIASLAEQAAAQGITYIVSTGDSGAEGCDNPNTEQVATQAVSVNALASNPYTIAVGGTQFNEHGDNAAYWSSSNAEYTLESALKYIPEDVWNASCTAAQCGSSANILAGGGGASAFFSKPSWQSSVHGIPSDGARDVPDVSLTAALHDPYLICLHGSCVPNDQGEISFYGVGGTSAAAPSFAGIMGLVDITTMSRQGQADYVLYRLAAAETLSQCNGSSSSSPPNASTCVFNDVTSGNNAVPGETGYGTPSAQYQSGTGYDLATGLGSVNIMNLIQDWGNARSTPSAVTNFTLNPTSGISHGSPVTVNITVAPESGTGAAPTGDVSLIANIGPTGTNQEAVDHFTLGSGGTISGTTHGLPGGSYTVTAHYEGDGTYTPSDFSPPIPVTIAPEASTTQVSVITFDPNTGEPVSTNARSAAFGSPYVLRVTVAGTSGQGCPTGTPGGTGCPTGTVTLDDNGAPLDGSPQGSGSYALNTQGYAEDQAVQLPAGSHSLAASYGGDNSFASSSSPADAVTITQAATTIGLAASPASAGLGSFVTLTATVTTQSNASQQGIYPTGSIQFMSGGHSIATVAANGTTNTQTGFAQASAVLLTSSLPLGTNSITATYSGDANYAASGASNAVTVTVLPATTTAVTSSNSTISQGTSVTFTATVTPGQSGGPAPTGTVQFLADGADAGGAITVSNGQAQFATTSLPAGAESIVAVYSGDSNYGGSTSPAFTETVTPAPTFTIAANPTTIAVTAPGQSGSTTLTFTSENGFSSDGAVTIAPTCSGLPSETTCGSGVAVTIPANGTATATITFLTTAPSAAAPDAGNRPHVGGWRTGTSAWLLAAACLLCAAMLALSYRESRRRWGIALVFTMLALLAVSVGCGGGGGGSGSTTNPGTPVGNYTNVSVTVTVNGVTQTISGLTLNVE